MKKIGILLMGILLILTPLSGCKATTPPSEPVAQVTEGEASGITNGPHPVVTITMADGGQMVLELYPEVAPNTVNNFISLSQKGFYNGLIFHRVITGFMIQGGDPTGTGMGGPGYGVKGEFNSNKVDNPLKHERGVISMARSQEYDSAGSQFFIMHANSEQLDGNYAAFGKIIEGLDVLDAIATVKTDGSDKPTEDQKIKEITVNLMGYAFVEPQVIQ